MKIYYLPFSILGRQELYNLYAPFDLAVQGEQQMVGFSNGIFEPKIEPIWWYLPEQIPQRQTDLTTQFLIYMS